MNKDVYDKTTYRVSDEDRDSLFTNAVVSLSTIHCLTMCTTNGTIAYFESNSRRCRCAEGCVTHRAVNTGRNYVDRYTPQGKL